MHIFKHLLYSSMTVMNKAEKILDHIMFLNIKK